jgi:hypothetical protein
MDEIGRSGHREPQLTTEARRRGEEELKSKMFHHQALLSDGPVFSLQLTPEARRRGEEELKSKMFHHQALLRRLEYNIAALEIQLPRNIAHVGSQHSLNR